MESKLERLRKQRNAIDEEIKKEEKKLLQVAEEETFNKLNKLTKSDKLLILSLMKHNHSPFKYSCGYGLRYDSEYNCIRYDCPKCALIDVFSGRESYDFTLNPLFYTDEQKVKYNMSIIPSKEELDDDRKYIFGGNDYE